MVRLTLVLVVMTKVLELLSLKMIPPSVLFVTPVIVRFVCLEFAKETFRISALLTTAVVRLPAVKIPPHMLPGKFVLASTLVTILVAPGYRGVRPRTIAPFVTKPGVIKCVIRQRGQPYGTTLSNILIGSPLIEVEFLVILTPPGVNSRVVPLVQQ